MNQSRILPFYMAYPLPMYYQQEDSVTRDLEYLQQMYPSQAKKFQKKIAEMLDHIDYEGSMIYDEYPDKWQIYRLTQMIVEKIRQGDEEGAVEEDWNKTTEFVQILLCYEIYRRRHSNNNGILKFLVEVLRYSYYNRNRLYHRAEAAACAGRLSGGTSKKAAATGGSMQEELRNLLEDTVNDGLYRITISNPRNKDRAFKIKIRPVMVKGAVLFQETVYEGTKVFHENRERNDMIDRIEELLVCDFKQGEVEHRTCRAAVLVSKKGRITVSRKRTKDTGTGAEAAGQLRMAHNRTKRYILQEGIPVPFLVDLGVQTREGRVVHARYDKFRQINRFLEFIEDILPTLSKERTVQIIDFGCGKSYLTFAMYYYLHELKDYEVEITGLDLKEDVIDHCNALSEKYGYAKLHFRKGDIAAYEGQGPVDMVVTLHACDTATDYALSKAVGWQAGVILSVPCCQHEVNRQIQCDKLAPVLKYGIVKERISALVTDALRAQLLEAEGYAVDILEFIDMEHTPKNLLIRAVKRQGEKETRQEQAGQGVAETTAFLHIEPTLQKLLYNRNNDKINGN